MEARPTNRNYCRELAIAAVRRLNRNGGANNQDLLLMSAFMIFFLSYFSDSLTFEALDALRHSPLCRHKVKQLHSRASTMLRDLDTSMCTKYGEYADAMAQVNLGIGEAFEGKMERLRESVRSVISMSTDQEVEVKTRVTIALMMLEFATQNFYDRMEEAGRENPIIEKLRWVCHDPLRKAMTEIYERIGVPTGVERDLTVRSIWLGIQTKWLDAEFIASNIQRINGISDEETEELREAIRVSHDGTKTR